MNNSIPVTKLLSSDARKDMAFATSSGLPICPSGMAQKATNDSDVLSLFGSLDGYIEFKDRHHVQKALEVNDPEKKAENQITD